MVFFVIIFVIAGAGSVWHAKRHNQAVEEQRAAPFVARYVDDIAVLTPSDVRHILKPGRYEVFLREVRSERVNYYGIYEKDGNTTYNCIGKFKACDVKNAIEISEMIKMAENDRIFHEARELLAKRETQQRDAKQKIIDELQKRGSDDKCQQE